MATLDFFPVEKADLPDNLAICRQLWVSSLLYFSRKGFDPEKQFHRMQRRGNMFVNEKQLSYFHIQPGFLPELTHECLLRRFAKLHTTARRGPKYALRAVKRMIDEQNPIFLHAQTAYAHAHGTAIQIPYVRI